MNSTYELDLISRTLNSEGIVQLNEIEIQLNELEKLININYKKIIEEGNYPEKAKSLEELNDIYNYANMYIKYPMLIGKTVIGVICDNQYSRAGVMLGDLGINERKYNLNINNSIPTIYVNGIESLNTINQFDFVNEVTKNDIKVMLDSLIKKRKIDLRQSIVGIVNSQPIKYENIAVIFLPSFGYKYSQSFKQLVSMTDFMILSGGEKLQISLNYLSNICYKNKIYLKASYEKELSNLNLDIDKFEKDIIENSNKRRYNIDFNSMIDNVLLKQISYYKEENIELDKNIMTITKAILLEDDNQQFRNLRKIMEKKIKDNKHLIEKIESFRKSVFEVIYKIINIMEESLAIDNTLTLDNKRERMLYERGEKLLQVRYYDEAQKIINIFRHNRNFKEKILNLKLAKSKNMNLNKDDLYYLYESNLKEDYILKTKIEFRKELKISEREAQEIVENIKSLTTGEEFYIKANSLKNKSLEASKRFYKLGSEQNHVKCKDELYNIYLKENDNIRNMENLAALLHKEANYYMANYYKENKLFKHIFYLKLAAALKHSDAIYDLAEISLNNGDYNSSILLYDYLFNYGYKEDECVLKLGESYFRAKQYYKATDILEKCEDRRAYYMLGEIYEHGMGRMRDYNKAMYYYNKASDWGHLQAKTRYIKIKTRVEENKKINASRTGNYSSSSTYQSNSSSSSSTSRGCFITTAACDALGKGENCDELIRIKEIRDTYIVNQPNGEALISEYYRIAPQIVMKIDESDNPIKEYIDLWNGYIDVCYKYILEQKYDKMMNIYINMVEYLKEKYL